jgi:hypothetical protein
MYNRYRNAGNQSVLATALVTTLGIPAPAPKRLI